MGQFSWLDCKDGRQVLDNKQADVYLLIPKQFGGGHIHETCYDGYGYFGPCDVYEEVALWNRKFLTVDMIEKPERDQYSDGEDGQRWYEAAVKRYKVRCRCFEDFVSGLSKPEMRQKYGDDYLREIGIEIACDDKDNAALRYPIKITHDASAVYEDCGPSPSDPDQGWPADDD